jgi:histidine triad (HIT) family protein
MAETIFKKIIDREIPADIVYEDDLCIAFHDVQPQAPIHVLLIPKREIENVAALTESDRDLAGHLLVKVHEVATLLNLEFGYRIVANCGQDGGQSVDHLHIHILGGRKLTWPPG